MIARWLGVAAFSLVSLTAAARAAEDWQYWSTWAASHKLSDTSSFSVLAEMYARDDMSDDYVYDEYVTYERAAGRGFGWLAEAYFESVETPGGWNATRSAVLGGFWSADMGAGWKVRIQDRLFYSLTDSGWDYHRPRLTFSGRIGKVGLSVSDELRVDLSGDRAHDFFRNRLFITGMFPVSDSVKAGIGYVRQWDRTGDGWDAFNGLQTVVKWEF